MFVYSKDVRLPVQLQRAMAAEAEAAREARAKVKLKPLPVNDYTCFSDVPHPGITCLCKRWSHRGNKGAHCIMTSCSFQTVRVV